MKRITAGLICLLLAGSAFSATYVRWADGNWSTVSEWGTDQSGGWAPATFLPPTDATVVLNGNMTVDLDVDSTIASMSVANDSNLGTVNVNNPNTLTVAGAMNVGNNAGGGTGTVNQSDGLVTVGTYAVIGSAGSTSVGNYYLSGGTLQTTTATPPSLVVNPSGLLAISGTGALDSSSQMHNYGTVRISGDAATIDVESISGVAGGVFDFVFDDTGVSGISASSWVLGAGKTITVDGSAYTGGAEVFPLLSSPNHASFFDSISVTGMGTEGVDYTVTEDVTGVVLTVIPEPATFGLFALIGGAMLFVRRLKQS